MIRARCGSGKGRRRYSVPRELDGCRLQGQWRVQVAPYSEVENQASGQLTEDEQFFCRYCSVVGVAELSAV